MDLVFDVFFFCLLIASGYGLIPSAAFLLRGFARLVLTQWDGWTDGWGKEPRWMDRRITTLQLLQLGSDRNY
jgi:hypothetical protein